MSGLFAYPPATEFGKAVPKTKIMAHARATASVKQYFTDEVSQIIWTHKLFPNALNISAHEAVQEIEVFEIVLKGENVSEAVLALIDRAVAFPIIFELHRAEHVCAIAAYKRPSGADSAKWVVGDYFKGPWQQAKVNRVPLPLALNMSALYREMLQTLMPSVPRAGESMEEFANRVTTLGTVQKACDRLEAQMNSEKQFNRKVELNTKLRQMKMDLDALKA